MNNLALCDHFPFANKIMFQAFRDHIVVDIQSIAHDHLACFLLDEACFYKLQASQIEANGHFLALKWCSKVWTNTDKVVAHDPIGYNLPMVVTQEEKKNARDKADVPFFPCPIVQMSHQSYNSVEW